MTWELIIARAAFTSCYDRLLHDPGRASAFPAGLARLPDRQLVLVSGAESRGHEMNAVMAGADSETRMNGRLLELMRRPTVQAPAAFAVFGTGEVAGMFLGRTMTARGIKRSSW